LILVTELLEIRSQRLETLDSWLHVQCALRFYFRFPLRVLGSTAGRRASDGCRLSWVSASLYYKPISYSRYTVELVN